MAYHGTMSSSKRGPAKAERVVDPRSLPYSAPRWRGDLPHIFKPGCSYFKTFCLADAIPQRLARRQRLESLDDPDAVAGSFEPHVSQGSCMLKHRALGSMVEDALLFFQGQRYDLFAWVVMPNHAHAVVAPYEEDLVSDVLHSWKSYTSHQINKMLRKKGSVWEGESFDHLIRDEQAFSRFIDYVERNPVTAGLCHNPEDWPFSSARFRPGGT